MIWEFAVPARILEIGEPCDPDILPEKDLRTAWLLNCKLPAMAHVCRESRGIALAKLKLPDNSPISPNCSLDPKWWWYYVDIVHLNTPEDHMMTGEEREQVETDLLDMMMLPDLGKQPSIMADIVHPFLRFRRIPDIDSFLVWDVITSFERCIIALHTVCVRATKEDARKLGLFGNGEEPAQLIDPYDKTLINRFRVLWNDTVKEISAEKFFDTIDTERFEFRVRRWRAEMAIKYIRYQWLSSPDPPQGARTAIELLNVHPKRIDSPEVQQYLAECPTLDMRILFRLCPPAVPR